MECTKKYPLMYAHSTEQAAEKRTAFLLDYPSKNSTRGKENREQSIVVVQPEPREKGTTRHTQRRKREQKESKRRTGSEANCRITLGRVMPHATTSDLAFSNRYSQRDADVSPTTIEKQKNECTRILTRQASRAFRPQNYKSEFKWKGMVAWESSRECVRAP